MEYLIGVDLGGTQMRAALVAASGALIAFERTLTYVESGPDAVITRLAELIARVREALPPDGTIRGVGVGSPGPLNPQTGVVYAPPNMQGWYNIPLGDRLAALTGLPVRVDNDGNVAALGEWRYGGGVGTRHMVYITVSTGIGAGVIVDGRLLRGRLGLGTELGTMILDAERQMYWENLASGTALGRAAAAAMIGRPESLLHQMATPETVSGATVAQAAAAGDKLARELMDREANLLAMGFVSIIHAFSPEIILVGGSVALHNPGLLAQAREITYSRVLIDLFRNVPIELARLGDRAGVLGAAALLLEADEAH